MTICANAGSVRDCVHVKIDHKRSVASETFYVTPAVTEEGIYIGNVVDCYNADSYSVNADC